MMEKFRCLRDTLLSINPVTVLQPLHQCIDIQTRVHAFNIILRKAQEQSEPRDRSQLRGNLGHQANRNPASPFCLTAIGMS